MTPVSRRLTPGGRLLLSSESTLRVKILIIIPHPKKPARKFLKNRKAKAGRACAILSILRRLLRKSGLIKMFKKRNLIQDLSQTDSDSLNKAQLHMIDKLCPPSCFHFTQVPRDDGIPRFFDNARSGSVSNTPGVPDGDLNYLDSEILITEVHAALNSMKISSSPGLDQFTYGIIRALPEEYLAVLTAIYNSISRGFVPGPALSLCWYQSHRA